MPGPLQGFRILDITTVRMGPYAAQTLGDLGADVIKVESPEGDMMRNNAPGWFVDQTVGLVAAYTVLAALLHRERCGEGQYVEVPMFESMAQYMMTPHLYGETFRPAIGSAGYVRVLERRPFKTKDGHLCAIAYTPPHRRRFFDVIGRPELKDDARFKDGLGVARHVRELYDLFAKEALKRTTADWLELLEKADIPAMPMHTPETLLEDPHHGGSHELVAFEARAQPPGPALGRAQRRSAARGGVFESESE